MQLSLEQNRAKAAGKGAHILDQEQLAYLTKEHEIKNNIVGQGFSELHIHQEATRVNYIGQICRAQGFESDHVNIYYELVLPPNWELELPPRHLEDQDVDIAEYNRVTSQTHECKGKIVLNKFTGSYEYVYNLCFQLDFQLICKDSNFEKRGPVLVMQICHHDETWGKYTLEGYSFYEFPRVPGHYREECSSWRPYESLSAQVFSFFVGGATKARDMAEIAANSIKMGEGLETVFNRYTLKTISAGKVFVEMNMCTHNAIAREKNRKEREDKTMNADVYNEQQRQIQEANALREVKGPELMTTPGQGFMNRTSAPDILPNLRSMQ